MSAFFMIFLKNARKNFKVKVFKIKTRYIFSQLQSVIVVFYQTKFSRPMPENKKAAKKLRLLKMAERMRFELTIGF